MKEARKKSKKNLQKDLIITFNIMILSLILSFFDFGGVISYVLLGIFIISTIYNFILSIIYLAKKSKPTYMGIVSLIISSLCLLSVIWLIVLAFFLLSIGHF